MWATDVNGREMRLLTTSHDPCLETTQKQKMTGIDKYRVVISGIRSSRFTFNTLYNFKVYIRLYSLKK
jgi:hypothetical protein